MFETSRIPGRRATAAIALSVALAACQPAGERADSATATRTAATPIALDDAKQRASYMVGLDLAKNVAPIREEVDLDTVERAMRASLAGEAPLLDDAALATVRQQFSEQLRVKREATHQALAAKNLKDGEQFLAANATRPGIEATASGLQYEVITEGRGPKPGASDTVRVHYVGTLLDGTKFDSTYDRDHDVSLALNSVMPGWSEAVTLMPVGSRYRFWIPPALAYGERGAPSEIGPNATLVFEVELLEVAGGATP